MWLKLRGFVSQEIIDHLNRTNGRLGRASRGETGQPASFRKFGFVLVDCDGPEMVSILSAEVSDRQYTKGNNHERTESLIFLDQVRTP